MTKEPYEGLREARHHFNDWAGPAVLWIDTEEMTAWTEVQETRDYSEHPEIHAVLSKDDRWANLMCSWDDLKRLLDLKGFADYEIYTAEERKDQSYVNDEMIRTRLYRYE